MIGNAIPLLLFLCICVLASAKTFDRCSLAKQLIHDGVERNDVHHWVCMAEHESGFSTTAQNTNSDGSANHGIFQINDFWDCEPSNGRKSRNFCKKSCSMFEDTNLIDDVACVRQKLQERHQGFVGVSYGYQQFCDGISSRQYFAGCNF